MNLSDTNSSSKEDDGGGRSGGADGSGDDGGGSGDTNNNGGGTIDASNLSLQPPQTKFKLECIIHSASGKGELINLKDFNS